MMQIRSISYPILQFGERSEQLLREYADECSIACIGDAQPDWQRYKILEEAGALHAWGLFDEAMLVGFGSLIATVLPHYSQMVACVESLFVSKSHRGTLGPSLLLGEMENYATSVGCKAILYSAPAGGQLEVVLGKRYRRTNTVFCKPLSAA